jgi:hypothetical protein
MVSYLATPAHDDPAVAADVLLRGLEVSLAHARFEGHTRALEVLMASSALHGVLYGLAADARALLHDGITLIYPSSPRHELLAVAVGSQPVRVMNALPEPMRRILADRLGSPLFVVSSKPLFSEGTLVGRMELLTLDPKQSAHDIHDELQALATSGGRLIAWAVAMEEQYG